MQPWSRPSVVEYVLPGSGRGIDRGSIREGVLVVVGAGLFAGLFARRCLSMQECGDVDVDVRWVRSGFLVDGDETGLWMREGVYSSPPQN